MTIHRGQLRLEDIDKMSKAELGLLLLDMTLPDITTSEYSALHIKRAVMRAATELMVAGATNRHELNLNTPRYTQVELDLMEDWREVSPEELFGDLDEHELHKMGYAIAVDHKASVN